MGAAGRHDLHFSPAQGRALAQQASRERPRAHGRGREVHLHALSDGQGESRAVLAGLGRSGRSGRSLYREIHSGRAVRLASPQAGQRALHVDRRARSGREVRRFEEAGDGHRHRALHAGALRPQREGGLQEEPAVFPAGPAFGGRSGVAGHRGRLYRTRFVPHRADRRRALDLVVRAPVGSGRAQEVPPATRLPGFPGQHGPRHLAADRSAALLGRTSAARHLPRHRSPDADRHRVAAGRAERAPAQGAQGLVTCRRPARRGRQVLSVRPAGGPATLGRSRSPERLQDAAHGDPRLWHRSHRWRAAGARSAQGRRHHSGAEDPGIRRVCSRSRWDSS